MKANPRSPQLPNVSIATGTNSCLSESKEYFVIFFVSDVAAAAPASMEVRGMYD
jgi:hypothetical protein